VLSRSRETKSMGKSKVNLSGAPCISVYLEHRTGISCSELRLSRHTVTLTQCVVVSMTPCRIDAVCGRLDARPVALTQCVVVSMTPRRIDAVCGRLDDASLHWRSVRSSRCTPRRLLVPRFVMYRVRFLPTSWWIILRLSMAGRGYNGWHDLLQNTHSVDGQKMQYWKEKQIICTVLCKIVSRIRLRMKSGMHNF